MKDRKGRYFLGVVLLFIIFYLLSVAVYFLWFNEPIIYPVVEIYNNNTTTTYREMSSNSPLSWLVASAFACLMLSFFIINIYQWRKLDHSDVITEQVSIVSKEVSISMGLVSKGGGGAIRKNYIIRFKFPNHEEKDLMVDQDHYVAASEGDVVNLQYKCYHDTYTFLEFK